MLDPAIAMLIVACSALLFATAAIHKLRDLRRFDEIFSAYGLVPGRVRLRLSRAVPLLEVLVAAGLLLDVSRKLAASSAIALLVAYAIAIVINLARGRRDLACGCGGPDDRRPIAPWMVWRNILTASLLALVLLPWGSRPWVLTDLVTVVFGTITCALVYLCIERLLDYSARVTAGLRAP
jgi:uncharacterized membrane protein YphA (DoxX/SURF4 family)